MPVWHNARLTTELLPTYHCPALVKRGVLCWGDLVDGAAIPLQFWELLAPTWQPVYLKRVEELQAAFRLPMSYGGPELGLLYMQHKRHHAAHSHLKCGVLLRGCTSQNGTKISFGSVFGTVLLVGTKMERMGEKLCPLDSRLENPEHVFQQ